MTDPKQPVVGFIGLGAIGRPMAGRIIEGGFAAVVTDIDPAARAVFQDRAIVVANSAEVGAQADIAIVCLATLGSYREAVLGAQGLVQGGRTRICVVVGTTGPALVRELEAPLSARGITLVDAPMTGGVARAKDGTLTVMVAGPPDAVAAVTPLLSCYGSRIVAFGERTGTAQTMKLLNNIMSAANFTIAVEAFVCGAKAGLDPERMLEVINHGTGQNDATRTMIPNNVLTRDFALGSHSSIVVKDLTQAIEEAEALGSPVPMTRLIRDLYERSIAEGRPDDDQTLLVRHFERQAGVEVAKTR